MYGFSVVTLIKFGAIPKVLSASLCIRLQFSARETKRCIIMVVKKEALVLGGFLSVPVMIGLIRTEVSYQVLREIRYDFIILRLSLKRTRASLDFDEDLHLKCRF